MRLIDADKIGLTDFEILMCNGDFKEALKMLLDKISNQPTDYSVEKVVDELESELEKGNIAIDLGEFRLFEIVKQGGVADDVCEWKITNTKKLMPYEASCGNEDLYDNSYKYCPYCGKKIKVVVE